ncbi:hypothetical protein [Paraburkholderia bannensis]|uniref:hypothetical protein n=1 Tax=Paraburkholderia bannensis TaxID=765414 RepID=UPI002AB790AD|nr:hypothetical protein [Paraburkholderia bannensis]
MTLPSSFPLSMSQVAAELGLSLPLSLSHPWVLALVNKTGLPASFTDLLGRSGSFNGSLTGNAAGGSNVQISFGGAPMFGSTLNVCTLEPSITTTVLSFNSVPQYTGNLKLTNNTTGVSLVLPHASGGVWQNSSSAPANLLRAGFTDSFTLVPST